MTTRDSRANAFERLGVPPAFDIDKALIETRYLERAASLHPDLAVADAAQREAAEQEMARLNQARATLLNAEARANELLALIGGPDGALCRDLPPGFLMEMMELGSEVDDALASSDDAAISELTETAMVSRSEAIERVSDLFRALGDPPGADDLRVVRVELNRWRYVERLLERLRGQSTL
ncbi:MAG: hypothetical protein CMJ31_09305 [Phycisphaerae bacterium]|nr:hypothetical protein [Phycisphaerae bacterium]